MSLQLALTQLESLAAMLNERKRESEQYQAFRETIKSIGGGKFVLLRSIVDDPSRILLRQDLVTQLEFDNYGSTVGKSKTRKLLLLNDMLICTTVTGSLNNPFPGEIALAIMKSLQWEGESRRKMFSNGLTLFGMWR
jgi:Rho guanine nucleotide exchange factor 10